MPGLDQVAAFVLPKLLDKTGLLDKLGLGNPQATAEQVAALQQSINGLRDDIARVQNQIARSTEIISLAIQDLATQLQKSEDLDRFLAANTQVQAHINVFDLMNDDFLAFLGGTATTITATTRLSTSDLDRIRGANGNADFRDRVFAVHKQIVPDAVGGLVTGVLTLLARAAVQHGKLYDVVESYFLNLLAWEYLGFGLYLDVRRSDRAEAQELADLKRTFNVWMSEQRVELLRAAEEYTIYRGPRGFLGFPHADLDPMRRADELVHQLRGDWGWITAAIVGFTDPVVDELAKVDGMSMQGDVGSTPLKLDANVGQPGRTYYQRNAEVRLPPSNGYFYIGDDYVKRAQPDAFQYRVAGSTDRVRVVRYKGLLPPPFFTPMSRFAANSGEVLDDGQGRRAGTSVWLRTDPVTGMQSTLTHSGEMSLRYHANGNSSPMSELIIRPRMDAQGTEEFSIVIPPNPLTPDATFLAPIYEGNKVRFGMSASEFFYRPMYQKMDDGSTGFGLWFHKPDGSMHDQFVTPLNDGTIGVSGSSPFIKFRRSRPSASSDVSVLSFGDEPNRRYLYLDLPMTTSFYASLIGFRSCGKQRDLGAFRDGTRINTGHGGYFTGPHHDDTLGEFNEGVYNGIFDDWNTVVKSVELRVVGKKKLDFKVSAAGTLRGQLLIGSGELAPPKLEAFADASFNAGDTQYAHVEHRVTLGKRTRGPLRENIADAFSGDTAVSVAVGSKVTLGMTVRSHIEIRTRVPSIANAKIQLAFEKLLVDITTPGDF